MIGIIDYGAGNFTSVFNALNAVSRDVKIIANKRDFVNCTHIVLPGVGTFGAAVSKLNTMDLTGALRENVIDKGKFFLGICVGMQLLADVGYEFGEHRGLEYIRGKVVKLDVDSSELFLPHMGWNGVLNPDDSPLFKGLDEDASFYFVHSYHFIADDKNLKTVNTFYGKEFVSALSSGNIHGVQFHPEKSQFCGLKVLSNFISLR